MKKRFLVINGPNLNLLGEREPEIYGKESLEEIQKYTEKKLEDFNLEIDWFQSNLEGEIVSKIQQTLSEELNAIIINPGGYSHTSVAILDAIKLIKHPIIEVHLSNTHTRENFRKERPIASAVNGIIEGFGKDIYYIAI